MKTTLKISLLLFVCIRVHAQFIGYTAPQSLVMTNTQLFGAATVTAPATSNIFTDIGNTVHFVSYKCTNVNKFAAFIEASPTGTAGTYSRISSISYNVASGGLTAYDYQKFIRINVTALTQATGSCTFAYTGTSTPNQQLQGIFQNTGATLLAWENATGNLTYNFPFQPTNARLGGTLWFQYIQATGTCASLTLSMTAYPSGINASFPTPPTTTAITALPLESVTASTNVAPALVTTAQAFSIPDMQATDAQVTVIPGSGSGCGLAGALFTMWYSTGPPAYGAAVQGPIPSGQANRANPNKIGCAYNATPPTVADGSVVDLQCDEHGALIISGGGTATPYAIATSGIVTSPTSTGFAGAGQVATGNRTWLGYTACGDNVTVGTQTAAGSIITDPVLMGNNCRLDYSAGDPGSFEYLTAQFLQLLMDPTGDLQNLFPAGQIVNAIIPATNTFNVSSLFGEFVNVELLGGTSSIIGHNANVIMNSPGTQAGNGISGYQANVTILGGTIDPSFSLFGIANYVDIEADQTILDVGYWIDFLATTFSQGVVQAFANADFPNKATSYTGWLGGACSNPTGNCLGMDIRAQTGASLNYAIRTSLGEVEFGDETELAAGTTSHASLVFPNGVAESSPAAGDMYADASYVYRFNGTGYAPLTASHGVSVQGGVGAATGTSFMPAFGGITTAFITTEAAAQLPAPATGTVLNFLCRTSTAQSGLNNMTITLRKNGASTGLVLTIAAGAAAGTFISVPGTVHVIGTASADLLDFQIVNNAAATSAAINGCTWSM